MVRSILWFRQDLRLHDNESLREAMVNSDELIPVYVLHVPKNRFSSTRLTFLLDSLRDLREQLRHLGSDLIILKGKPEQVLYDFALHTQSRFIYCNRERTRDEVNEQDRLEKKLWTIGRELRYGRGKMLYYTSDLPFPITHCPDSFVLFKKEVEQFIPVRLPLETPSALPPLTKKIKPGKIPIDQRDQNISSTFNGGEKHGLYMLDHWLETPGKQILGNEEKVLSPWISMGNLSPKKVYHASMAWGSEGEEIRQGLLYRDYLRLMGKKYGDRIFFKSGITNSNPVFQENKEALIKWKTGNTGVAIIDAAMHQLEQSGWIPDALRKLTATYFLKVLNLDWRLGAHHFESSLIDYDPCSTWVSWLILAGLGPEPNFDRTMNFEGSGKRLDPEGKYIQKWLMPDEPKG